MPASARGGLRHRAARPHRQSHRQAALRAARPRSRATPGHLVHDRHRRSETKRCARSPRSATTRSSKSSSARAPPREQVETSPRSAAAIPARSASTPTKAGTSQRRSASCASSSASTSSSASSRFRPARRRGLRAMREGARIPIVTDEDSLVAADLPALYGCVDGINVKLAKSRRHSRRARDDPHRARDRN